METKKTTRVITFYTHKTDDESPMCHGLAVPMKSGTTVTILKVNEYRRDRRSHRFLCQAENTKEVEGFADRFAWLSAEELT